MVYVTGHAIERYIERVRPVSIAEARNALSSPIIRRAIEFGARYVKLARGQHVVIDGSTIVTVLPKEHPTKRMTMERDQRYAERAISKVEGNGNGWTA